MEQILTKKKKKAVSKEKKLETLSLTYNPNDKATIAIIKIIENCGLFNVVYGLDNEDCDENLEPYTKEELHEMIAEGEKQIADGQCYTTEEVIRMCKQEIEAIAV
ncbi:MAG: hypothetical protein II937_12575 [Bacteroidales bacterium]|nr:hypothetical protein [Bacteroidales bacterium]